MPNLSIVKPFLLTAVLLAVGLPIIIGCESVSRHFRIHPALLTLPVFVLYNLLIAHFLGLKADLQFYWDLKKSHLFIFGCLAGAVLVFAPIIAASLAGKLVPANASASSLTFKGLMVTLCIISWEELWFRGMALNNLADKASPLTAAIFISVGFVLLHLMNPSMNLKAAAPNLFLASLLLCAGYLHFKSIYFPLGLHFFWNAYNGASVLFLSKEFPASGMCWGENGLLLSFLLATGSVIFAFL